MRYYSSYDLVDDTRTLDDDYTFEDTAPAYLFFEYLLGITGIILANKFIVLDKHLKQLGDLDYSLVNDPIIFQDATAGQDSLRFSYPIERDERLTHTWGIYRDKSTSSIIQLSSTK